MGEASQGATGEGGVCVARRDSALRARFEHLRALNSAWNVLAPLGLSSAGRHIVETGRAISDELTRLAAQPFEERDRAALPKLDEMLADDESEMRTLAFQAPVAQLRATLPGQISSQRRGLLDLLDVMLGAASAEERLAGGRLSAIDYLITLHCTGGTEGDGSVRQDPVGLTSRLSALCERATDNHDTRLAEIEAEFYAAAGVDEDHALEEVQLRALRQRKRDLGASFFAPNVLRAIVAYNAALSLCLRRGARDSRDWGSLSGGPAQSAEDASVFGTEVLPQLAHALKRRAEGKAPNGSAIDRVAWCLDLDDVEVDARSALFAPSACTPGDIQGTTVLVGLLCRAAPVLEGEFPAIGISPEMLSLRWVGELDDAIRAKVNAGITGDGYDEARGLSELRTRFLYSSMSDVHRERRRSAPRSEPNQTDEVGQEARQLATEAVAREQSKAAPEAGAGRRSWRSLPGPRLLRIGSAVAVGSVLAVVVGSFLFSGDLDRLGDSELDALSPYLASGARNGEGQGPAFVGEIEENWLALSADAQRASAAGLVDALRAQGVREVMVYDHDGGLRIQALGEQNVRVLSAPPP